MVSPLTNHNRASKQDFDKFTLKLHIHTYRHALWPLRLDESGLGLGLGFQDLSRSSRSVPIESPYATSY